MKKMNLEINLNQSFKILDTSRCFFPVFNFAKILAISPITLFHSYCSMVIKLNRIVELDRKLTLAMIELKCITIWVTEDFAIAKKCILVLVP